MQISAAVFELEKITKQRNFCLVLCVTLIAITLIQSTIILSGEKSVVLVPSTLSGEVGLSNKKVSSAYLENITRDVINVMLDVTPENTQYSTDQILKITHPEFYGELKQQLLKRADDVASRKITTNFYAKTMVTNPENNQVLVSGKLATFLGTKMVLEDEKNYRITYAYNNFKLLIIDFREEAKEGTKDEA